MLKQRCRLASQFSAFAFATRIVQLLFFLNPKFPDIFCACTARFVSDLVGNLEDRFCHVAAQFRAFLSPITFNVRVEKGQKKQQEQK